MESMDFFKQWRLVSAGANCVEKIIINKNNWSAQFSWSKSVTCVCSFIFGQHIRDYVCGWKRNSFWISVFEMVFKKKLLSSLVQEKESCKSCDQGIFCLLQPLLTCGDVCMHSRKAGILSLNISFLFSSR